MTPTQLSEIAPVTTQEATASWDQMVSSKLEQLVGELLTLTEKYENSTSPQGKNLYGKKLSKIRTKVTRLAKLAR